jgi:hypothetical protein
MPKKNWGENSKSVEARARKAAVKAEERERKEKEAEDKLWEDNDKHVLRKQERKEDKERKEKERLQKKLEAQKLLEEEMKQLKSHKPDHVEKVRVYDIEKRKAEEEAATAAAAEAAKAAMKRITEVNEPELTANPNRVEKEPEEARNIDQAIAILSQTNVSVDMHPEKRMKAAWLEFEAKHLERLKKENSNMRLSQIKQLLKKEWDKSPDNPLNKIFLNNN